MKGNGYFDDAERAYVITDPITPRPWINYLGNRRLVAFISQQAGGLLWYKEPQTRRISRYQYTATPPDSPGFYIYLQDADMGTVWNPHFAPTRTPLDIFSCRHAPGVTTFQARKDDIIATVDFFIPPDDDVMLWHIQLENRRNAIAHLTACSYLEFGLLEFMREMLGWCYLKNQISFTYQANLRAIDYGYHVFEAPFAPAMLFGCSEPIAGYDCSRDAFLGPGGTPGHPAALMAFAQLTQSELPDGGHGCAALACDLELAPGARRTATYCFSLADQHAQAEELLARYQEQEAVEAAREQTLAFRRERAFTFQATLPAPDAERFVNCWNPANCMVALEQARGISTDHMGTDGLKFRDTTQDALAVAHLDPAFAWERLQMVLSEQGRDGSGCYAFHPFNGQATSLHPERSDNTVWQIFTLRHLIAEVGDADYARAQIPFRDGDQADALEHVYRGLRFIHDSLGPHGLPLLKHADWNDGLAIFGDAKAESVMLGMQLLAACRTLRELEQFLGENRYTDWCDEVAQRQADAINRVAWDGAWYRRLIFSDGEFLGTAANTQGAIYLNPQSWAVLSGVGTAHQRGEQAMQSAHHKLNSPLGLHLMAPPFTGYPTPDDPPLGSRPGRGENGGIFCHANTWAIMAEALLGHGDRAYAYYAQLLPERIIDRVGSDHYQREPYVYVSSIAGRASEAFGRGGISWLTGTASWMYVAMTQYILGIRPTLEGLCIAPCVPADWKSFSVDRIFRGCRCRIQVNNPHRKQPAPLELRIHGEAWEEAPDNIIPAEIFARHTTLHIEAGPKSVRPATRVATNLRPMEHHATRH